MLDAAEASATSGQPVPIRGDPDAGRGTSEP
jgi:hypothetical protein